MTVMLESSVKLRDGFRVGYASVGDPFNPHLVFLHGLSLSARAYRDMLFALADKGFCVTALDLPDHGDTDSLPWGHTVRDMALIVREALDKIGVYGKAVVVGHSMGGGVAVDYASRYPGNVSVVIALDAACGAPHHESIRVGLSLSAPLRAAQLIAGAVGDVIGDGVRALSARTRSERLSLLSTLRQSVSGVRCVRAAWALMQNDTESALRALRHYSVPTVHVHGTRDRIIDVIAAVEAAIVSGGSLVLVPGAFHSWMLVDPQAGANVIAKAVERAA